MFEEKPDYNYLRGLFKSLLQKSGYDADGKYDWVLKKEGKEQQLQQQHQIEERKAPLPKQPLGANPAVRTSKNNLYDNREERKEMRANAGA